MLGGHDRRWWLGVTIGLLILLVLVALWLPATGALLDCVRGYVRCWGALPLR